MMIFQQDDGLKSLTGEQYATQLKPIRNSPRIYATRIRNSLLTKLNQPKSLSTSYARFAPYRGPNPLLR